MPWQPEKYRDDLKLMAHRLCLDRRLKRRFDSSELVQESMETFQPCEDMRPLRVAQFRHDGRAVERAWQSLP